MKYRVGDKIQINVKGTVKQTTKDNLLFIQWDDNSNYSIICEQFGGWYRESDPCIKLDIIEIMRVGRNE